MEAQTWSNLLPPNPTPNVFHIIHYKTKKVMIISSYLHPEYQKKIK